MLPPSASPPSTPPPEPEIEALIELLCQGNAKAAQDLARIGAPTLPQLMARFPGPVISERAGPSSRASECGPLLQALANIGSPALPDITRSTEDQDARVRRWATLLLGEIPGPEACRAVVQRLADEVPRVHQAALDAARLLLSSSAANLFRKTLFEVAEAEDAPLTLRLRTLEHVARLRDSASVPRLIALLSLDTEPVVHKALWTLTVITRQDFARDAQAWSDWWQAHQSQHRFQWLIEALDHHDPRLRKAAADELFIEAKDSFGYSESLPQPERLAAQQRYREWWETMGARRFGRLP
jgi:HEAT repeat protein